MKKIIILIVLSIFFFNFSYAEKYWSNKKDGPTTVEDAEKYIFSNCLKTAPKDTDTDAVYHCVFKNKPLYGIWYSVNLGFVAIYPLSNDSNISYKVKLVSAPRWMKDEDIKSIRDHEGTTEGTIFQKGKNNYFGYNKTWWIQNDGSYKYTTNKGKLVLKSENHFIYTREAHTGPNGKTYPKYDEYFYKILPNKSYDIIKFLKKYDKSRDVSDYDMFNYEDGSLHIRLNKEKDKEKSGKNKYIQISSDGAIFAGTYTWDKNDKSKIIWDSVYCQNNILYIQNYKYIPDKKVKSYCNPLKITYSTYLYYKYRNFIFILGALLLGVIIFYTIQFGRKNELTNYNKKNKKKFATYSDYKEHKQKLADIKWEKDQKEQEKERKAQEAIRKAQEEKDLKEQKRLEAAEKRKEQLEKKSQSASVDEDNNDNLMGKIKRLKILYKNGTLTKAEFEKAKNKLLK